MHDTLPIDTTSEAPVVTIRPKARWRGVDFAELGRYSDLFFFLVWRSVKVRYAQSALGVGWAIIQPLASMLVFTVIFGRLAKVGSDGQAYAIFAFAALVPWTYFSNAMQQGTTSLSRNSNLLSKVYFPRLIIPMSEVTARLVDFLIAFVILLIMLPFYGKVPNAGLFAIPLLVAISLAAAAGAAMGLAALSIQYRDVNHAVGFAVQLLMYAAPVVYSVTLIPESLRPFYAINPMVGVIEGFRAALLGSRPMPWDMILIGGVTSMVMLAVGVLYFQRREHLFADVA